MKHYIWFYVSISILCNCSTDSGYDEQKVPEGFGIKYDMKTLSDSYESGFLSEPITTQLIKLELTPNSIVDQVAKFEVFGDYFIVLTQGKNKDVLLFDSKSGEFVYSFKMNFPHLLLNPLDFSLYEDKIYINDYDLMHIVIFDISNPGPIHYNRVIKSAIRFDKFSIIDNNHILVYPYTASLNSWEGNPLNYDLLLLDSKLELVDKFLSYDIEKYHYGVNYSSTSNINFIAPFYKYNDQYTYFSQLLSDTTYQFNGITRTVKPFTYHENNDIAKRIAEEKDLATSISLMEESGKYFGAQILYMDNKGFIFSSVSDKKIVYISYNVNSSKYNLIDQIDFSTDWSFNRYPLGLPIIKIDKQLNAYALIMPHRYDDRNLKSKGFLMQDNPGIIKYKMSIW